MLKWLKEKLVRYYANRFIDMYATNHFYKTYSKQDESTKIMFVWSRKKYITYYKIYKKLKLI